MAHILNTKRIQTRGGIFKRTAAGTGTGNYRRGKVMTSIDEVQPGQLLVHESILFKAINLVKVTQTFQDKFYGIFVSPENPNEKSKPADEEFVVYPTDLEKGEYYIALEPAPADVGATSGDASGTGTKPVTPTPQAPTKPEGTEGVADEDAVPEEEESAPAGKGASKKTATGEGDPAGAAALSGARIYDKGSEVGVRLTSNQIRNWAQRWPGLHWPTSGYFASFNKSNGDLVELETGNHGSTERWDDAGLAALLNDAYVYGMQKLEKKAPKAPVADVPAVSAAKKTAGKSMEELEQLWIELGDIPTDEDDNIEVPFLDFEVGTNREEIWHWFEEQNSEFSVYIAMYGKDDVGLDEESTTAAVKAGKYNKGFEKQHADRYEGAVAVEGILHKYDVGLDEVDPATAKKLKHIAKKLVMTVDDWANLAVAEEAIAKQFNNPSDTTKTASQDDNTVPEITYWIAGQLVNNEGAASRSDLINKLSTDSEVKGKFEVYQMVTEWFDSAEAKYAEIASPADAEKFIEEFVLQFKTTTKTAGQDTNSLYGVYNELQYEIWETGGEAPLYTGGNSPAESQTFVSAEEGVGKDRMREFCEITGKELAAEQGVTWSGASYESPDDMGISVDASKTAGQDEPANSKEAPDANPTTFGNPTHETPLGHFMDSNVDNNDADRVIDEVLTYIEAEHPTELHVEYEDGSYIVMTKEYKPLAEIWTENDRVQVTALVGTAPDQTTGEKASEIVDLILKLKDYKEPTEESDPVEDFVAEEEPVEQEVEGLFGSRISAISSLLANTETLASAVGGEGDDGSAYDLLDGGRNFTGVNETVAGVIVDEYLTGKATSFASLKDFAGFAEDVWGMPKQAALSGMATAWHNDDRRALVAYITRHAKKDMLN